MMSDVCEQFEFALRPACDAYEERFVCRVGVIVSSVVTIIHRPILVRRCCEQCPVRDRPHRSHAASAVGLRHRHLQCHWTEYTIHYIVASV